jgi:hypothetical protein
MGVYTIEMQQVARGIVETLDKVQRDRQPQRNIGREPECNGETNGEEHVLEPPTRSTGLQLQ